MIRAVILISWDGQGPALSCISVDTAPDFDIILFNYTGNAATPSAPLPIVATLNHKTECKGQIYHHFANFLEKNHFKADYVALFDDDIEVAVSALNDALAIGRREQLDSFALSLTPDSHVNHQRFIQRPGSITRPMDWVEVMMPFYRQALFLAAAPFYQRSISSYGIDQFVMPMIGKLMGAQRVAIIDQYSARHMRPVTSNARVFSNGMTAIQERIALRRDCLSHIGSNAPNLIGSAWYYQIFAPLNGPGRFWVLRLGWPIDQLRRLARLVFAPGSTKLASDRTPL